MERKLTKKDLARDIQRVSDCIHPNFNNCIIATYVTQLGKDKPMVGTAKMISTTAIQHEVRTILTKYASKVKLRMSDATRENFEFCEDFRGATSYKKGGRFAITMKGVEELESMLLIVPIPENSPDMRFIRLFGHDSKWLTYYAHRKLVDSVYAYANLDVPVTSMKYTLKSAGSEYNARCLYPFHIYEDSWYDVRCCGWDSEYVKGRHLLQTLSEYGELGLLLGEHLWKGQDVTEAFQLKNGSLLCDYEVEGDKNKVVTVTLGMSKNDKSGIDMSGVVRDLDHFYIITRCTEEEYRQRRWDDESTWMD